MKLGGRFLTEVDLKDAGFRKLGKNVQIHERASIYCTENISIGDNVRIGDFNMIIATGPVDIGSHVSITNFCYLGGKYGITLSDFTGLGMGVKILSASDDYTGEMLTNETNPPEFRGGTSGKVTIGKHVQIGAGSVILPGCNIGEGTCVGAMSLVTRSLEPWAIFAGVPVRWVKARKKDLLLLEQQLIAREKGC